MEVSPKALCLAPELLMATDETDSIVLLKALGVPMVILTTTNAFLRGVTRPLGAVTLELPWGSY